MKFNIAEGAETGGDKLQCQFRERLVSYVAEDASIILVADNEAEVSEAVPQLVRIGLDKVEAWIPADEALGIDSENHGLIAIQRRITTAELPKALAMHPGAAVLDVRSVGEYEETHIQGAKHVAYNRLAARLAEVPRTQPRYVHCGSGLRASLAVPFLARENFHVIHVDGPFGDVPASIIG